MIHEVVKEFKTNDGLGAMLWKKIYAMSYALCMDKLFWDTPISWFLIHESDKVKEERDYYNLLHNFNNLLFNPWKDIDFENLENAVLCSHVGMGAKPPGFIPDSNFLKLATTFNKFQTEPSNSIVIHIRRGNVSKENPRYTPDNFYIQILKNIEQIIQRCNLDNPEIIICTDAPDNDLFYLPKDSTQQYYWTQNWINFNEKNELPIYSFNFQQYRDIIPNIKIINNLNSYDTFLLMLFSKVLIVSNSSFSQCAGLLSKNMVIGTYQQDGISPFYNIFANSIGNINADGSIVWT